MIPTIVRLTFYRSKSLLIWILTTMLFFKSESVCAGVLLTFRRKKNHKNAYFCIIILVRYELKNIKRVVSHIAPYYYITTWKTQITDIIWVLFLLCLSRNNLIDQKLRSSRWIVFCTQFQQRSGCESHNNILII